MKTLFFHPTGNANVRAASKGLSDAGLLGQFYTTMATFSGTALSGISNFGPFSELKRREFPLDIKSVTHTWPWYELGRIMSLKLGFNSLIKHEKGRFCIDEVYRNLDFKVASRLKDAVKSGIDSIYAYEDGASYTFAEAKKYNLQCFYDLPIGYWRSSRVLLENEYNRWPDWIPTLTGFHDSEEKLSRKDDELKLADRIFVASKFTADTLKTFPGQLADVSVIPYGFPKVVKERNYLSDNGKRPIKLLFVGGLSQRKGIADMFEAVKEFGSHVELTVVGRKASENCAALDEALARHTWISSLPHSEVLKLMRSHDVLLFPSLFEGFGLVITEAMSQGTPVITTERTAGPDLINHGENGWLVNAGSTEELRQAIGEIVKKPSLIESTGREAIKKAESRPWEVYGYELASSLLK